MRLLREIHHTDCGYTGEIPTLFKFRKRVAGVVYDQQGKIAVLHFHALGVHQLPGGGIDPGETAEEALVREMKEEAGVGIDCIEPIGLIIEYEYGLERIHFTYGFMAQVKGEKQKTAFTEKEQAQGAELLWISKEAVCELIAHHDTPPDIPYVSNRIRELEFLSLSN